MKDWLATAALAALLTLVSAAPLAGAEGTPAARADETNSLETLRTYLQLQEQLHGTQLAVEQNRREAREAAAQTAEALTARLQGIETALATQRAKELEAMQSANRVMLVVAGSFAGVGIAAMLLMAWFQWRAVNRLAEISAALPLGRGLGAPPAFPALGPGDGPLVNVSPAEQSSVRLLGALEKLEKRIHELEHPAATAASEAENPAEASAPGAKGNGHNGSSGSNGSGVSRLKALLGKAQSMLTLDQPQAALDICEQALALEPGNADVLVKKGLALEKLQKLSEAVECYDQAIAADSSMTIAYLHKGGVCNRLERFAEALQCYEQALRTQEKN